jgi:hypothetical protein
MENLMFRPARIFLALSAAIFFSLNACTTTNTSESLTLNAFTAVITAGDTTDVLVGVKNARDAQGRMQTDNAYTNFYLVSQDTTIARIVQERRVLGVAKGTTTIMAKDHASKLSSAIYNFQVN